MDAEMRLLDAQALRRVHLVSLVGSVLLSVTPPFFGIHVLGLWQTGIFMVPDPSVDKIKAKYPAPSELIRTTIDVFSGRTFLGHDSGYVEFTPDGAHFIGTQTQFTLPRLDLPEGERKVDWNYAIAGIPYTVRITFQTQKPLPTQLSNTVRPSLPPTLPQYNSTFSRQVLGHSAAASMAGFVLILIQTYRYNWIHNELNIPLRQVCFVLMAILSFTISIFAIRRGFNRSRQLDYLNRAFPVDIDDLPVS